jgi:predicted permease
MNWFRQLLQRREIYNDLSEEIQQHLEQRVKERMADGMSQEEAEHAARREFGNVTRIEQSGREVWQWPRLESALTDGKIALRQLKKAPGFTLVSLLILSFAIGASTATFSIVDSVLLRPYAFRDSGRLVVWRETIQELSKRFPSLPDNYRHYLYLRAHSGTIADASILQNASFAVEAGNDHPQMVKGLRVSPNFFSVLGVSPIVGRTFLPQEMQEGDRDEIVITYRAWQTFFEGDPGAIGHTLRIQGRPAIIVGVLPKEFEFPNVNEMPGGATPGDVLPYEIFQPLVPTEEEATADGSDWGSLVIARLKEGVTAKQAESELDGILKAYSADHHLPVHLGAVVESFSQEVTGNISKAIWLLFGAVLGVLLIACVNLSGLQLARAIAHDRTNAVRAALGAGRIRLFQASVMESLLLAVIGGCAGIGVAFGGIHIFQAIAPANLPRLQQVAINWPVLGFACCLSLLTAVLSGIFPALRSLRTDPQRALQASSARLVNARQAALGRQLLVTLEITCTVILLLITALMLRSFSRVLHENHAFNASRVAIAEVNLLNPQYQDSNSSGASVRSSFVDRALERLRANPGVEIAAITSHMPLTGDTNIYSMYRPDHPLPESELPQTNLRNVSPGYFAAMQTPLVAGVNFTENERDHPVDAIISQRAAQLTWPDGQALGRKFRINGRVYSVIGIAADARIANLKENVPVVYLPYWHDPSTTIFFLIRSSQAFASIAPAIRREIWDVDPETAIPVIKPLDTQMAESVAPDRLQAIVLTAFGGAALMLAILGVYGVLAYSVSLRTAEFGIRIAVGSSRLSLIRLVLVEASKPVTVGLVLGALVSVGVIRAIRSLLYETSAADLGSIVASVSLLLVATFLAAFLPAYRASRTDPIRALHEE